MNRAAVMFNPQQAHKLLTTLWAEAKPWLVAGHRLVVSIKPETRSLAQNARLWAMLTDVSEQVVWHGRKLTPEDWKHVFTASVRKLQVVPNLDGSGFVALGMSTSQMTRSEMTELQELIAAFGAQHGVRFSAPEYAET